MVLMGTSFLHRIGSRSGETEFQVRGGHDEGAMESCRTCVATEKKLSEEGKNSMRALHESGIGFLTAQQLRDRMRSVRPPILMDVLPADNYREMRIKGSINMPVDVIEKCASMVLPDKDAEIVVYCACYECPASVEAGQMLKKLGYTHVYDFKGGLSDWQECRYPMEGSKAEIKKS